MMQKLYETLGQRRRPEDVAQMVLELLAGRLDRQQTKVLEGAARGSLKKQVWAYSSMAEEFARPVGMQRQAAKAEQLFTSAYALRPEECDDPEAVERFLRHVGPEIRKAFGASDFKADRLNGEQRQALGLELSRRRYNKLFRLLTRMEDKLYRLVREWKKRELTMIGKSGLASKLTFEEFSRDVDSACFIAYFTARANLRSEFTIYGQQRPYDEIADMLFTRCRASGAADWWAIAHVYPSLEVLGHLSDAQKGELLGRWFGVLQEVAGILEETWNSSDINRVSMVVRRGNDSSTWNNMANAWNKARDNWIALLHSMGLGDMLAAVCPGKALRLMAADVVMWHVSTGGRLDPDTDVWSELPLPWEVLSGKATCTKAQVEAACRKHGVDSVKRGWVGPKPTGQVAPFRPTPELVHGVTVSNPFLATLLRNQGFFSGKHLKPLHR